MKTDFFAIIVFTLATVVICGIIIALIIAGIPGLSMFGAPLESEEEINEENWQECNAKAWRLCTIDNRQKMQELA